MIIYNEVKIKGNTLHLNFELDSADYYDNSHILGVRIDTPLTYGTEEPFYQTDELEVTEFKQDISIIGATKELLIITPIVDLNLSGNIPCGADIIDKTAIYDESLIDNKGLAYLDIFQDNCIIPKDFINFILNKYALDLAITTCNYTDAIKYWKYLMNNKSITTKGCGCGK